MAWGDSTNIVTTNLDAGTDTPAAARPDLKAALDELTLVINGRAQASGVAPLDASSKILATYLPNELNSTSGTALTLDPATGKVNIEEIVNLAPQTLAQLNGRTDQAEGDVAYCSNGNGGSKTVAVYDGTAWKVVALGATIS
tara:strand:+ start:247 stop:672 length:426 start_codon:yes stop_codon:yes gene_type:complete